MTPFEILTIVLTVIFGVLELISNFIATVVIILIELIKK